MSSVDGAEVRRAVFNIQDAEGGSLRVDIVEYSRVRLRLMFPDRTHDLFCATLEELPLLAAAEPALSRELYEQLLWELDLMGLRGT